MKLSDTKIRGVKPGKKPLRLPDGKGLYLEVRPSGTRLWRYRYKIGGTENMFALGEYHLDRRKGHVSLDDARKARAEARQLVKRGIHPSHQQEAERHERIAANAATFEAVAREWLAEEKTKWTPVRSERTRVWLERDVFPYIGSLPIREVKAPALLEIMRRVASGAGKGGKPAPSVAILLRQYCSRVFQFAMATLRADGDPTTVLRGAVAKPRTQHRSPLGRSELGSLVNAIGVYGGDATTARALKLLLLTFVRQGELRGAQWEEFDLDRAVWTIPAERMKMRTPHVVPLSRQAVALLRELNASAGNRTHLFPNHRRPRSGMGNTTLNAALVRIGYEGKLTPHGFRSTASTILNEMGFRADVIERQLAHDARDTVRASYNHAEYLPERKKMMQQWANLLDSLAEGAQVIPLQRRA